MPCKIISKKGIVIETLMRLIIALAIIFLIVVPLYGKVKDIIIGSGDSIKSFESLVEKINSGEYLKEGEARQELLSLDPGSAVIGFSKEAKEFRCYYCGGELQEAYYYMEKPKDKECNEKSCMCLCTKGLSIEQIENNKKISCEKQLCRILNNDISPKTSLEKALNEISKERAKLPFRYPYWENGFFFVRAGGLDISNGLPPRDIRKITLFIEKKQKNQVTYIGVCPSLPCIQ